MLIDGSCHCRNIRFRLDWQPEPEFIPARACDCSFCVKHGGVWTSCPAGKLQVTLRHPDRVAVYAFETKTADFHVCCICGVVPVVSCSIDERLYAVVSVNAFDDAARSLIRQAPISFSAEATGDRLARRQRNWIAQVEFLSNHAGSR